MTKSKIQRQKPCNMAYKCAEIRAVFQNQIIQHRILVIKEIIGLRGIAPWEYLIDFDKILITID